MNFMDPNSDQRLPYLNQGTDLGDELEFSESPQETPKPVAFLTITMKGKRYMAGLDDAYRLVQLTDLQKYSEDQKASRPVEDEAIWEAARREVLGQLRRPVGKLQQKFGVALRKQLP